MGPVSSAHLRAHPNQQHPGPARTSVPLTLLIRLSHVSLRQVRRQLNLIVPSSSEPQTGSAQGQRRVAVQVAGLSPLPVAPSPVSHLGK